MNIAQMPKNTCFEDIKTEVDKNKTIGLKHFFMVGDRCIIALRKYTYSGRVIKTNYLHIYHVNTFDENRQILTHWAETKTGSFRIV